MKKLNIFFILFLFLCLINNAFSQSGTLRDRNGNIMRGTPMVIGKSLSNSVAFAEDVNNWIYIRDTLKMNTVRLCWVDPWYLDRGYDNWTVWEAIPHIEKCVQNATSTGMNIIINYHNTGEKVNPTVDYNRNHDLRVDFWRNIAIKFKDNNLVFFELSNEPVFYHTDYVNSTFKNNLMDIYYIVRYEAPDRQILMFSFNSTSYDLALVIENYKNNIDWSKTSVALHGYSGDGTSKKITDIMKNYRVMCTEWDYPGTNDYVKSIDGFNVNAGAFEAIGLSWTDWRGWMDVTLNEIIDILIPDAKARGYWWGDSSNPTPDPTSTPTASPAPATGLPGDVNNDNIVDIVDALLVAQYYVGLNPANFDQSKADTNCDGAIDIVDALLIAQFYVGLISEFC